VKIKSLQRITTIEKSSVEIINYGYFPVWIWPFECEECKWELSDNGSEINGNQIQVIVQTQDGVNHYHEKCFKKIIES